MSGLSLMPQDAPSGPGGFRLPGKKTRKALSVAVLGIGFSVFATVYSGGQAADAQKTLNDAKATKQQIDLKTQTLKQQLGDLQGAGGADRLTLIKQLLQSRMDFKKILLAISNSSPPGLTLDGFSAAASGAAAAAPATAGATPSAAPAGGGSDVQLTGSAPSEQALTTFISRLKQQPGVIREVKLRSVSSGGEQTGAENAGRVQFSLTVSLVMPPAPPGGAAAPAAPATAGAQPAGDTP